MMGRIKYGSWRDLGFLLTKIGKIAVSAMKTRQLKKFFLGKNLL